jgi:cytochrome c5
MNLIKPLALLAMISMMPMPAFAEDAQRVEAGKAVYQAVCIACHAPENVMVSAPKAGDVAEWARRAARAPGGIDMLTDNAVNGVGAMPPKGGAAELTRTQVRDAIEFMRNRPKTGKP